jgi:hypothetical protein
MRKIVTAIGRRTAIRGLTINTGPGIAHLGHSIAVAGEEKRQSHEAKSEAIEPALLPRPLAESVRKRRTLRRDNFTQTLVQLHSKYGVRYHHIGFSCQKQAERI